MASEALKQRFCQDYGCDIRIYEEPYFSDRLALYDDQFKTLSKWNSFMLSLSDFDSEDDFFAAYDLAKINAIKYILQSDAFKNFTTYDSTEWQQSPYLSLSKNSMFYSNVIGKSFFSVSIKDSNYSSLRYFSKSIVDNTDSWKEFISKFTDTESIINSEYIEEAVFNGCNVKRIRSYTRAIMSNLLEQLLDGVIDIASIAKFTHNEIVLDSNNLNIVDVVSKFEQETKIPFNIESFTIVGIYKNGNLRGFAKKYVNNAIQFIDVHYVDMPAILRTLKNEPIQDSDLVFEYKGELSKFVKAPVIEFKE